MRPRAAEVEALDPGEPVARVAEERAPGEELVERVLAVHGVPAAEAVFELQVRRRHDVASSESLRETGRVVLERPHGCVREALAR